jgi:hypothetical protein
MKTNLWIVIIVVIGFLGFLLGYSVPSFLQSSSGAVIEEKKADTGTKLDKSTEDYYKNLLKDDN